MCLVAAEEEQISEEKSTPGDDFKEIEESEEDPSSIGISLMIAGGLATSEQVEGLGDGSKTTASLSHSRQGFREYFNVRSKKGSQ